MFDTISFDSLVQPYNPSILLHNTTFPFIFYSTFLHVLQRQKYNGPVKPACRSFHLPSMEHFCFLHLLNCNQRRIEESKVDDVPGLVPESERLTT